MLTEFFRIKHKSQNKFSGCPHQLTLLKTSKTVYKYKQFLIVFFSTFHLYTNVKEAPVSITVLLEN